MNLLLTGSFNYTEQHITSLQTLGYKTYFIQQESDKLPLPTDEIDAVVCNGLFLHHNIDKFTRLKYIQLTSAGLDRVPLDKIQERNIVLCNARGVYSIPMAEWTIFRVLEHYKDANFFHNAQLNKQWIKNRQLKEINGCRVGIIGAGSVGQEVAKRFTAFSAHVDGFDVYEKKQENFENMFLIQSLESRIKDYDILIITAPLTPQTHHLISKSSLEAMKSGTVLVNIARGALIDESAMCDVLARRTDLHAILDVFEQEPLPKECKLWSLSNVSISPHNSFVSNGNATRMFNVIYSNLESYITKQA